MNEDNLGTVFGPSLLKELDNDMKSISLGNELCKYLIIHYDEVFEDFPNSNWEFKLYNNISFQ